MKRQLILGVFGISLAGCAAQNANPDKIFVQDASYLKHISVQDTARESDAFNHPQRLCGRVGQQDRQGGPHGGMPQFLGG